MELTLLLAVGISCIALLGFWYAVRTIRLNRHDDSLETWPDLAIDISALPSHGPLLPGKTLEFYGIPVRLCVLVMAPVGRHARLPSEDRLPEAIDHLLPGLYPILQKDRPLFRAWPFQLSREGFVRSFLHHMALPGERGKNSPWSSIVGRFTYQGTWILVGMVFCSAKPNTLGQVIVDHEGRWMDVLRVSKGP